MTREKEQSCLVLLLDFQVLVACLFSVLERGTSYHVISGPRCYQCIAWPWGQAPLCWLQDTVSGEFLESYMAERDRDLLVTLFATDYDHGCHIHARTLDWHIIILV